MSGRKAGRKTEARGVAVAKDALAGKVAPVEQRGFRVMVGLSEGEYQSLSRRADEMNLSRGAYVRHVLMAFGGI